MEPPWKRARDLLTPYLVAMLDIEQAIRDLETLIAQAALPPDCVARASSIVRSLKHLHRHVRLYSAEIERARAREDSERC